MIIANHKPIRIVGYTESSMVTDFADFLHEYSLEIISPEDFLNSNNKDQFQYIVPGCKNLKMRHYVTNILDSDGLDLVTYVHDSVKLPAVSKFNIGAGSFVYPFSYIGPESDIGRHCIIGTYSLVGHYTSLGKNTQLKPGCMVIGKSHVGSNCILYARVTIVNSVTITNDVEIYAFSEVRKDITEPGIYGGKPIRKILKF